MEYKTLWMNYFKNYPLSTIQDFIKLLYQATLGSAHLIENELDNYQYLLKEYESIQYDETHPLYEKIGEKYVRIHLEAIPKEHLKTMHRLFMKSVEINTNKEDLLNQFLNVEKGIQEGWIPFELETWKKEVDEYILKGLPVVSHSEIYRKHYHPHYRLMKKEYVKLIQLLYKIDQLKPQSILTIEGNSGAGKSSLATLLSEIYGFPIVHMDDFFLQSYQRSEERIKEIGGNVDYERFYKEVVLPLKQKQSFTYQVFDCQSMSITTSKEINFETSIIVEGSYSMHPYFKDYADLTIFLEVSNALQLERILNRNGAFMLERFKNEWIPKEDAYYKEFHIKEKADLILNMD